MVLPTISGWKEVLSAEHFSSVLDKIVAKSEDWIKFPCTIEDVDKAKTDWTTKFHIPTAIGAVDCTHVHIMKPSELDLCTPRSDQ